MSKINDKIIEEYLDYLTSMVNCFEFYDIDCFCEDNELTVEEYTELLSLTLKIEIDNKGDNNV